MKHGAKRKLAAKVLLFDIETAPKLVYVWGFFKANISPKQVLQHVHIMSYAAKWLGKDEIYYEDNRKDNDKKIVKSLVKLLDEADIVIAHNGKKFDLGTVKGRAVAHGITPPSPYKVVDTLLSARKEFNIDSNSLEYLAKYWKCTPKDSHKKFPGFELWLECLKGNEDAWEEMREYNIQDVETLEEIYIKMRPYISDHPNIAIYNESETPQCVACGSEDLHKRGTMPLVSGVYQRYVCLDCGKWSRDKINVYPQSKRKSLLTNAV
jgi:DNA polymerase elongation subunit (family B)